jgi:Leucine-rich repeat (LRR) protein
MEVLQKVRKINLDDNQLKSIPESISKLVNLVDISMAKNKIASVEGDAFGPLVNLTILDLHQNQLTDLSSIPNSPKLDQILLAFNQLTTLSNLERCPNLGVLDLHNNKMENLPDSVMTLYQMKTLKVSNNNLANINARLGLLDNLVRLSIEGNPLKRLKPAMRTAGAKDLKEFLKLQLGD